MSSHTLETLWPGLLTTSILAHLTTEESQKVFQHSRAQSLSPGTVFLQPGQPFGEVPLVATGEAQVYQVGRGGAPVVLGRVSRGRSVDLAAVLLGVPARCYARMATPGYVVWVQTHFLCHILQNDPNRWAYICRMTLEVVFQMWTRPFRYHPKVKNAAVALLVLAFKREDVEQGHEVVAQNSPQDHVWLLDHGQLALWHSHEGSPPSLLSFATPHTLVGLQTGARTLQDLVPPFAAATLKAQTPCTLWRLKATDLKVFLREHPFLLPYFSPPLEAQPPSPPLEGVGPTPAQALPSPADTRLAPRRPPRRNWFWKRWEFIAQDGEADCGATCLAMVCAHLHHPHHLHTIRSLVATTQTGTTLAHLAHGAKKLQLNPSFFKLTENLKSLPLPYITNQGTHFVVVVQEKRKTLVVADPAAGMRSVAKDTFFPLSSGVGLYVSAPQILNSEMGFGVATSPLWQLLKARPILLVHGVLLTVASALMGLMVGAMPQGVQRVALLLQPPLAPKSFVGGGPNSPLVDSLVYLCGLIVSYFLIKILKTRHQYFFSIHIFKSTLDHLLKLGDAHFQKFSSNQLMDVFSLSHQLKVFFSSKLHNFVFYSSVAIGILIYLFQAIQFLFFIFIILSMVLASAHLLFGYFSSPPYANSLHLDNRAQHLLSDGLRNGLSLKGFQAHKWWQEKWEKAFIESEKVRMTIDYFQKTLGGLNRVLAGTPPLGVFLWGAWAVAHHRTTPAWVLGVAAAFGLGGWALENITGLVSRWRDLPHIYKKWAQIFRLPQEQEAPSPPAPLTGAIAVENVSFSYENDRPGVVDVSFAIPTGHRVGVVGPSGSGKSTLATLLAGFQQPQSGHISFSRVQAPPIGPHPFLRPHGVALASGSLPLLATTVGENIALGPQPQWERVEEVAKLAQAHRFIKDLPKGYQHTLWEQGAGLSQGQKQCLALARALYPNPRILIIDGVFQGVDGPTLEALEEALAHICVGRTVFLIAPPLSTLATCDHILVLSGGQVVEQGSHQELMNAGGLYTQLAFRSS